MHNSAVFEYVRPRLLPYVDLLVRKSEVVSDLVPERLSEHTTHCVRKCLTSLLHVMHRSFKHGKPVYGDRVRKRHTDPIPLSSVRERNAVIETKERVPFFELLVCAHFRTWLILKQKRHVINALFKERRYALPEGTANLVEGVSIHLLGVYTGVMRIKASGSSKYLGILLTLVVLVALALLFDFDTLRGYVAQAGPFAPLLFILLKASTIVIAPLSGGPLYPLVGAFFGFWPGILYAVIGDFMGYTIAFTLSRKFGYPLVRKLMESQERGILPRVVSHVSQPLGFFQACIAFGFMPDVLSYAAGLSKLPYLTFILIIMPLSAVISTIMVLFGASIGSGDSVTSALLLPGIAALVMIAGALFFYRAIVQKNPAGPTEL